MKFIKIILMFGMVLGILIGCNTTDQSANNERRMPEALKVRYDPDQRSNYSLSREDIVRKHDGNYYDDSKMNHRMNHEPLGWNTTYDNESRESNRSNIEVADDVAEEISKIDGVDQSYVFVTDNNAYVAVRLVRGKYLSMELETSIENKVKKVKEDIDQVFISTNPDFFSRFEEYRRDIEKGDPISGLIEDFTETVRRMFPNAP